MAPQHDYILDNQNGAQFRADLNLALEAIATVNSGAAAPTTTYAYQYWADTTSGYLKQRDASNADWIVRGKLAADYGQAGQVLTSAGADEPAIWTSITEDGAWTVAEDATNSHYTFTGNGFDGTETNPTIYVTRGSVYNFTNADTVNGFQIQSVAGLGGAVYTDGTVNNPALAPNTSTVQTLVWTVQMDAPSELYYHSTTNSGPGGKIYVLNNIPSSIAATPEIVLEDSLGATAGIEQTAFIRDNDEFKIQTRSATDVLVSTDYNVTLGTSGATSHQWSIDNAEAVRIDSSGNVGIGTSNPSSLLTIATGTAPDPSDVGGNAKGSIYLSNTGGTQTLGALGNAIGFSRINTTRRGAMIASYQPTVDGDQCGLAFYTRGATATASDSVAERMVLDHAGNVGIGTSSPGNKLDVAGNAKIGNTTGPTFIEIGPGATENRNAYIDLTGDTTYTDYGLRIIRGGGGANTNSTITHRGTGNLNLTALDAGSVAISTSNSERMRIASGGNVGIGTSSPNQKLHVVGNQKFEGDMEIVPENTGGEGGQITLYNSDKTTVGGYIDVSTANVFRLYQLNTNSAIQIGQFAGTGGNVQFYSEGTEKLRIDSSGSVGIGTSSPGYALDIQSGDIRIKRSASDDAAIYFGSSSNNYIYGNNTSNLIALATNGSEKMRIDSSGSVGIGTSSPTQKLDLEDGAGARIAFTDTGTRRYSIGNAGTGSSSLTIRDESGSADRLVIDNSGNVGIGTSTPGEKLEVNGTIKATDINFTGLATYADDAAAGTGGLVAGDVYKTSTGELRIKL